MPPNCSHHWRIEPADGPKSRGICKLCGEERWFCNSIPEYDRGYDEGQRRREIVLRGRELAVY